MVTLSSIKEKIIFPDIIEVNALGILEEGAGLTFEKYRDILESEFQSADEFPKPVLRSMVGKSIKGWRSSQFLGDSDTNPRTLVSRQVWKASGKNIGHLDVFRRRHSVSVEFQSYKDVCLPEPQKKFLQKLNATYSFAVSKIGSIYWIQSGELSYIAGYTLNSDGMILGIDRQPSQGDEMATLIQETVQGYIGGFILMNVLPYRDDSGFITWDGRQPWEILPIFPQDGIPVHAVYRSCVEHTINSGYVPTNDPFVFI